MLGRCALKTSAACVSVRSPAVVTEVKKETSSSVIVCLARLSALQLSQCVRIDEVGQLVHVQSHDFSWQVLVVVLLQLAHPRAAAGVAVRHELSGRGREVL